jgi:asparagine synthase (glutamine-hydrolysing)
MCGIVGIACRDPRRMLDDARVRRMTRALAHRGPDGEGLHTGPGIALGIRRLSIVDLATGDQPIANEDGSIVVVCNGEIYNAPELRAELSARGHRFRTQSDVEPIVHLYEEGGPESVRFLRGMFAFAVWDGRHRTLMLARDRLGIKPLHYADVPDGLAFASEYKALVAGALIEPTLDPGAVSDLFRFGFVSGARTMARGIRRVPPGRYVLYRDGALREREYWALPDPEPDAERRSGDAWAEAVRAKLDESVRIHLRSDVPVGAWLSTGLDSSGVTSLAARATGQRLSTFSLGFADPGADELRREPTLDRFAGWDLANERVESGLDALAELPAAVWYTEDPTTSGLEVVRLALARASARRVKVVLTGEGADETFAGYPWLSWQRLVAPLMLVPTAARRLVVDGLGLDAWRPRVGQVLRSEPRLTLDRYALLSGPLGGADGGECVLTPSAREAIARSPRHRAALDVPTTGTVTARLLRLDLTFRLPGLITHTLDRVSMAYGLEARVPFLDHELVELAARVPTAVHRPLFTDKAVLRRALAGVLPPEILRRRKRGLIAPYGAWLQRPLPPFAEELLSDAGLRDTGWFDPRAVRANLEAHRRGRRGRASRLMAVLVVQTWLDVFVRGRAPSLASAGA